MKRKKSLRLLAIFVLSIFVLGACTPTAPTAPTGTPATPATASESPATATLLDTGDIPASSRDVINIQLSADPGNITAFGSTHVAARRVSRQIFEPLIELGFDGQIVGVLAEDWERDGINYIIHLRQGVRFHDGAYFTASDALYSIRQARESAPMRRFTDFIDVENSRAIDDHTLELVMEAPYLFTLTSLGTVFMVSEAAHTADDETLIGTGPYMFYDWVLGSSVTLQRFEDYWDGVAPIQTAVFRVIVEPAQRVIELEVGGVDLVLDVPEFDVARLQSNPQFDVLAHVGNRSAGFFFNNSSYSVANNLYLRRAIAYSIEKEGINNAVFGGLARPAVAIVTEQFRDFNPEWKTFANNYYQFNLDRAQYYFERSGLPAGTEINIMTNDNPRFINLAEILQAQLGQIGLVVVISTYESAVFEDNRRNPAYGWDISTGDYGSAAGHILSKAGAFFAATGSNRSFYEGAEFNEIIEHARFEMDSQRVAYYSDRVAQILMEDVPAYMIIQMIEYYAWHSDLQGFRVLGQNLLRVDHLYFR